MSEDTAVLSPTPASGGGDMKVLFPGTDITVNGETITVMPFFFGQHPKAVKLIAPVIKALQDADVLRINKSDAGVTFALADDFIARLPVVMDSVSTGLEDSIALLMYAIKKPREWFDTIPGDVGYELLVALFKENVDFFSKRILPMFGMVAANQSPVGEPSPPLSSAPGTPGPPSSPTP